MKTDFLHGVSKTRVFFRDCTEPLGALGTFEVGDSRVVTTQAGTYRENASQDNSRFGYAFTLRSVEKPHLIELVYPDDKCRTICVQDGTSYDLTMGIITGDDCPLTGKMQKAYNIFWPRALDQSILISSLSGAEPAAASSISIYELEELPKLDFDNAPGKRSFGIQYEDPCNIGASEGALEFGTWMRRHIAYMRASGQNRLVYPINWYHGPVIPVKSQPNSRFNTVVMPEERKQYSRSTFDTPDWLEDLLTDFDREGFRFTGSMTLMRLGRLLEGMNTDMDVIAAGADTYNNILYNGTVQTSTNDWTPIYNPINYPDAVRAGGGIPDGNYAYGERYTSSRLYAPIFNPLHPTVRSQIVEYFEEVVRRYSSHPSFEGISVNFWHGTMLWFGNLLVGYDDTCAELFSGDTGIVIPVARDDPERFAKRYQWLMKNSREAWIAWRCQKVCDFLLELRDRMTAIRKDMVLGISVWNETSVCGLYPGREGFPSPGAIETQIGCGPSLETVYRYGGLDLSLLADEPNIHISVERDFCRNAGTRAGNAVYSRHLTDPMWLDERLFADLRGLAVTEGFHFNCWEERWGRHIWFDCDESDADNVRKIQEFSDYTADYIFRLNSFYDDEKKGPFFYPSQSRIVSLFPSDLYFMELLGADLALHDALSVTFGGLYLDKQHLEEQIAFAKEYRKLPARKFTDVPGLSDPLCMRYCFDETGTWVYALNREPYDIEVSFQLGERDISLSIPPFELRVIREEGDHIPLNGAVSLPEGVVEKYKSETETVLDSLEHVGGDLPEALLNGFTYISARIRKAIKFGALSELRHLLLSYPARYARNLHL